MKNFYRLCTGIDVNPLMVALKANAELWGKNRLRIEHELTPHKQVEDIWLRFNAIELCKNNPEAVIDEHESINYEGFYKLPQARQIIFGLMTMVQGERLGRCLITKLPPGGRIDPHEDGGSHAAYYERYHVVLQGLPGSLFRCGGEQVTMVTGEMWWFDNQVEHEVINNSADDRIHLIIDIKACK